VHKSSLSYRDAGVDIDAGNLLVNRIKPLIKKTRRPEVLGGIGGFGALFELPVEKYRQPVLVSATDGVGTKLKLAAMMNRHETIGIDLVAMCVNDIVVCGAEPLYFLDYFASGKLDVNRAEAVVKGITEGCIQAGCALTGGETAELPGMYAHGEYDLAGFAVGIVEKERILCPQYVKEGDIIIGLASSGPHSNGYALIRKILETGKSDLNRLFSGSDLTLGETLLAPTRIYVQSILALLNEVDVSAVCHITGGGVLENLPRVLPQNVDADLPVLQWPMPPIFQWLRDEGGIARKEMYRTFNCGIGMIVCVPDSQRKRAIDVLEKRGETVHVLGEIIGGQGKPTVRLR